MKKWLSCLALLVFTSPIIVFAQETLLDAAQKGDIAFIQNYQDDINEPLNDSGQTALMIAAQSGNVATIKELVTAKADTEAKDNAGKAAIIYAAESGQADKVQALINAKANVNVKDKQGETPLSIASLKVNIGMVKALVAASAEIDPKINVNADLLEASQNGKTDQVKLCLALGANVNTKDDRNRTPLMLSSEKGLIDIAKLIIEEGADVNAKDNAGQTSLFVATVDIAEILIGAKANVNATENDGKTALIVASETGLIDKVKVLITAGANVNEIDNGGMTALMEASWKGYSEIVKALIAEKAEVNIKDKMGKTAMSYANGNVTIVYNLKKAGAQDIAANENANIFPLEEKQREIFVYKNHGNEKISFTVLTMDEAQKLYDYYKAQPQYAWRWPDGCQESRAMVIARDLESHGILVGKTIAVGDLSLPTANNPKGYVRKLNDEAIAVIVNMDGGEMKFVIDPAFFDKVVSGADWYKWINNPPGSSVDYADYFSRFTYFFKNTDDNEVSAKAYNPSQVQNASDNLKKCKEYEDKRFPLQDQAGK